MQPNHACGRSGAAYVNLNHRSRIGVKTEISITENREQRTENREQRTENREQRTENREQRTENREQRTELI
ncbi:hypothetical protein FDM99_06175 [Acinetobacter baumannii]|nr:hypothetical protein FDM99_06175 [Acinetobacter baumannii]